MRLLPESLRCRLRRLRGASPATSDEGNALSEGPGGRKTSAPWPWLCAITDIGKCRSNNEDAYYLSADGSLWIVADGMGGHAAGEIASALTIRAIAESMDPTNATVESDVGVEERLTKAFAFAHAWVSGRSLQEVAYRGMGSTAIVGALDGATLYVCHIGNLRAYHSSKGQLRRITNDHSWVWEKLVSSGMLTPDEARSHPQRRKVTQGIGRLRAIKPDVTSISLETGDRVLLCSDGLWEAMADEDINDVVRSTGPIRDLVSALVDKANAAGGYDNITAILYEYQGQAA
jgi:PPM family protein phosphatase